MFKHNEAFGLPKGTVRGIIAVALTAGVVVGFLTGHITGDQFTQLATMAVAFYFLRPRPGDRPS